MTLSVTINGEEQILDASLSLTELLEHIGIKQTKVAIERNLEIVPRSQYSATLLENGDRLEIVHFIGGG